MTSSRRRGETTSASSVLQGTTIIGVITLGDELYLELLAAKVMNEHLESYMYGPYF